MRKIRVAHVITRLCKGGAQDNTFHSVRLADQDRYEVDLISGPTHGNEGNIEDVVQDAGIDIVRAPSLVREVAPVKDALALRHLTRLFREGAYDIVHTHTSKAGFIGRLAARRANVPIVVHTPHGNIFDGYFSRLKTGIFVRAERKAAKWCDRIIELTAGGIDEHLAQGIGTRDQYTVIFSGIDFSPYDQAVIRKRDTRRVLGVDEQDFLIGGVGRLEPIKGFAYFIEAAERIGRVVPNARFIHAGKGSLETALRNRAKPQGDRFRFLGMRDDIPDLMAAMDILVLPSINEGMGRVILEAAAGGTPTVAAKVGGVPDVIKTGETGILVSPKSAEEIADIVVGLCQDRGRIEAMGKAAREFAVPDFGLDRMVMRIESLYEELIKEKHVDA